MKKVLYIGGFCMPDGNAAAQRVLGVAKAMRECGCEVRFCGLTRALNDGYEDGVIEGFKYINYPYPTKPLSWIKYLIGHDASINEIKDFCPEIVVLYNHPALAIEHITSFCHKNKIKVFADITEWYEPQGNPIFRMIKDLDTDRRMNKSHFKLDGLICISKFLTEFYRAKGVNVIEIPPLVDVNQDKWQQSVEPHQNEIRIVYAGSPGSCKDRLDLILKAMDEILSNISVKVHFDIIGITLEQYQSTWNDTRYRDYVFFNGRRPHREVIKKLLEADFQIFLRPDNLPNRAGFPTKFVETITSKTLPITNLSSNLSQYLQDGQNGFVIKSIDQDEIIRCLKRALSINKLRISEMTQGIDYQTFDYHNYIGECSKLL